MPVISTLRLQTSLQPSSRIATPTPTVQAFWLAKRKHYRAEENTREGLLTLSYSERPTFQAEENPICCCRNTPTSDLNWPNSHPISVLPSA
ncbi:hypothetical protein M407DRAFT_243200 [Tulasnella calospora MUT 4182]|uniref:Uncharacterized protein n=1 Tax=Tulasnella calospora MUT 4182 TaxID=1051891 RepID=A0A0C3QKK3_9AGAM|nr:hypothetical protein M407DRAFT_243200 [Tulasnella calospora MUT 4182]